MGFDADYRVLSSEIRALLSREAMMLEIYTGLHVRIGDPHLKGTLTKLLEQEKAHADMVKKIMKILGIPE